mgnify:FL=1
MKDKFYYVLKDCLSNRQSWVRETEIYFKFRNLKEKANNKIFEGNIILKILHKLINLPLNSLLFIKKVKEYYEYNQTLKEIEIINSEIEKYELEKSKTGE